MGLSMEVHGRNSHPTVVPPQKKKKKNHTLYCEKYMYVYLQ